MKNFTELEDDVLGATHSSHLEEFHDSLTFIRAGTTNWRAWALTSNISFLLLLILIFVLVSYDYWFQFHHRRVKNVDLEARTKINELVEENWEHLLNLAKDVLDCRLGEGIHT